MPFETKAKELISPPRFVEFLMEEKPILTWWGHSSSEAILDFWMGVSDSMRTLKKARECFRPWVDLAPPQM